MNEDNNHTGKRILCIEDERFISELYERALTKAGYNVTVVSDGAEALKQAQTDTYDIIMLDIMLPTMLGTEILKTLRNEKLTPKFHAKIIITTNLEQKEKIRQQIESLADGYVIKAAMTPREMVEFIRQIEV